MNIKFVLRNARKRSNLSQGKLAKLSGLSQSFISDIENKIKIPSIPTINKIAHAMKINPFDLLKLDSKDKRTLLLFLIFFL